MNLDEAWMVALLERLVAAPTTLGNEEAGQTVMAEAFADCGLEPVDVPLDASALRAGTVWVNTFLVRDLTAPFGGMGISGIGREGGNYALDFYSDLKSLQILEGSVG